MYIENTLCQALSKTFAYANLHGAREVLTSGSPPTNNQHHSAGRVHGRSAVRRNQFRNLPQPWVHEATGYLNSGADTGSSTTTGTATPKAWVIPLWKTFRTVCDVSRSYNYYLGLEDASWEVSPTRFVSKCMLFTH